jgi:hypothetical protein
VHRALLALVTVAFAAASGCGELREAPIEDGGATTSPGPDDGEGGSPTAGSDAGTEGGAGDAGPQVWATYDEAQKALEAKRYPGPLTAQGSKGFCTANHFVWRDSDGTLHSWAAATQSRVDYTFENPVNRPFFAPSDAYILVDTPSFAELAVYETGKAKALVTTLPYAYAYAAGDGAVIRADQSVNNVSLGGTKVRRWTASSGITDDISQVLPTQQPPAAFANDELVIPGDVTVPHPLYIVNVAKKTTTSVVFDGGLTARQVLPSVEGLLVSYARSGGTSALRLYKGNQDTAAARYELGDELANRPPLYPDSPPKEHHLSVNIAMHGRRLIYDSVYGIFAYDFATTSLAPVQLGAGKAPLLIDVMCVIRDRRVLVYRDIQDKLGQIWVVPLASVLP